MTQTLPLLVPVHSTVPCTCSPPLLTGWGCWQGSTRPSESPLREPSTAIWHNHVTVDLLQQLSKLRLFLTSWTNVCFQKLDSRSGHKWLHILSIHGGHLCDTYITCSSGFLIAVTVLKGYSIQWEVHSINLPMYNILVVPSNCAQR